jgi:small-conductance mechanosensitive channel
MRSIKPEWPGVVIPCGRIAGNFLIFTVLMTIGIPAFAQEDVSEADQAIRITKIIELDSARLEELESDVVLRETAFQEIIDDLALKEVELVEAQERLAGVEASGDADAINQLTVKVKALTEMIELEKAQSEVDFNSARILREQYQALEIKIKDEQAALDVLEGKVPPPTVAPEPNAPVAVSEPSTATKPGMPNIPGMPKIPGMPSIAPPRQASPTPTPSIPVTAKQIEARKAAEKSETEAIAAELAVENFMVLKAALQEQIALEQNLLDTAEQTVSNVSKARETRAVELEAEIRAGADESMLRELRESIAGNQAYLETSEADVERRRKNIADFNERLQILESEQISVERRVEERREIATAARARSGWLESPLHPTNLTRWAADRGPRIVIVIVATVFAVFIIRFFVGRVARIVVGIGRRKRKRNTNRADTLSLSFGSALTVIVVTLSMLLILQEAGVDIKTVLGGAAILGVAIAFGAQNLMRDYFNGFIILLEDQYELNDLVQINNHTGRVERVSLRTTVLRDLAGKLYFIPNGEIRSVVNRSYEWTRAILEVRVGYDENVDRIMSLLDEVARSLYSDPEFKDKVMDEPEMLGVDEFAQFGIVIKFMIRTVPDEVFAVKREILRRIKNRFDELGIRIPVPTGVMLKEGK